MKAGLQLVSVMGEFAKEPEKTLKEVARCGYTYLETADILFENLPFDVRTLRQIYDSLGLVHCGKHFFPYERADISRQIELMYRMGGKHLAVAADFFVSKDEILKRCESYNRTGCAMKAEGIAFLYHNHGHEFQNFDGKSALEIIKDNTDPAYVNFEMDVLWVYRGGYDPADVLRAFGHRVKTLHLKDFNPAYPGHRCLFDDVGRDVVFTSDFNDAHNTLDVVTDIGDGLMDIEGILEAAKRYTAVEYAFAELDNSRYAPDKIKAIEINRAAMRKYPALDD